MRLDAPLRIDLPMGRQLKFLTLGTQYLNGIMPFDPKEMLVLRSRWLRVGRN